jgi:hypothetical protein
METSSIAALIGQNIKVYLGNLDSNSMFSGLLDEKNNIPKFSNIKDALNNFEIYNNGNNFIDVVKTYENGKNLRLNFYFYRCIPFFKKFLETKKFKIGRMEDLLKYIDSHFLEFANSKYYKRYYESIVLIIIMKKQLK